MAIYKRRREVELGATENRTEFEPATYGFQIRRSNHSATQPAQCKCIRNQASVWKWVFNLHFFDLTEFLERRALVANTEFGKLVGSKQGEPRGKRPPWRVTDTKGIVLALSKVGEVVDQDLRNTKSVKGKCPVDSRAICKFCGGTHELEKCFKFRDERYAQRKDFVRKQHLCENCLKPNRIARRCRSLGACLLSNCGERHHSLLHPPSSSGTPMGFGESGRTQTTSDQVNTNSSEANCNCNCEFSSHRGRRRSYSQQQ